MNVDDVEGVVLVGWLVGGLRRGRRGGCLGGDVDRGFLRPISYAIFSSFLVALFRIRRECAIPLSRVVGKRVFKMMTSSDIRIGFGDEHRHPWPSPVVSKWNRAAAERAWNLSAKSTQAGSFLGLKGVSRAKLWQSLRQLPDWMVRDWIKVVTPSLLHTLDSKKRWGYVASPVCPLGGCVGGTQTITHSLLQCGNAVLSDTRTKAHDVCAPEEFATGRPRHDDDRKRIHILDVARTADDGAHSVGGWQEEGERV